VLDEVAADNPGAPYDQALRLLVPHYFIHLAHSPGSKS
jgi:hypothetical protein